MTPEEICSVRYPIPVHKINFVEEKTGHDPLQFLFRRCLTQERKTLENTVRIERQMRRISEKGDRTKSFGENLLKDSEEDLDKVLRNQRKRDAKLQKHLDKTKFIEARQDARSARQKMIGTSRLNTIKLKLRKAEPDYPCQTVKVISKIRPCTR